MLTYHLYTLSKPVIPNELIRVFAICGLQM